jgi:RHS repeat-associated protein
MFSSTFQDTSISNTYTRFPSHSFNGKEKDDEWNGTTGGALDFGARIYDPRLCRWLAGDPEQKKYASISPYVAFNDNPLIFIDPNGDTIKFINMIKQHVDAVLKLISSISIEHKSFKYLMASIQKSPSVTTFFDYLPNGTEIAQAYSVVGGNSNYKNYAVKLTSAAYKMDYSKPAVVEEIFHVGQSMFYGTKESHVKGTPYSVADINATGIQIEVEVKVYRAFINQISTKDWALKEFAENKNVTAYFEAIKTGDTEGIAKLEAPFRKEVANLAYQMTQGYLGKDYMKLTQGEHAKDYGDYVGNDADKGATPFFDKLAKKEKK